MTPDGKDLSYRQLRAPREDGASYVDPPLSQTAMLIAANRQRRTERPCEILGRPLTTLADEARQQLVTEAVRYTRSYRDVDVGTAGETDVNQPLLLAGHQPQMFHPGVWLKNFVLNSLAKQHQATAVNLVIDIVDAAGDPTGPARSGGP